MKRLFTVIASLLVVLFITSCEEEEEISVKYEVKSSISRIDVSYVDIHGDILFKEDVPVPWSYSFYYTKGEFVFLWAEIKAFTGSVTVTIFRKHELWKTDTSSGEHATATVSGKL